MGNTSSATWTNLQLLGNGSVEQATRREPFQRLRDQFAPVTNQSQQYADELARLFELRFEQWASEARSEDPVIRSLLADKIRGCIFGAALGDAVGLATEFLSKEQVLAHYRKEQDWAPGQEGVFCDTHRMGFPRGDWTDDTDQLVLMLHSLLETAGMADSRDFGLKIADWMEHGFAGLGDQGAAGLGKSTKSVLQHPEFLTDPTAAAEQVWRSGGGKVAPNGAVMRTAVCGIPFYWDRERVRENSSVLCRATHADPRCLASCHIVSCLVSEMLCAAESGLGHQKVEQDLQEMVDACVVEARDLLSDPEHIADYQLHASKASLQELHLSEPHSIGYTFKCVFASLLTLQEGAARGEFASAMIDLVMEGGDADTNGAVAGALLGCHLGYSALPREWVNAMPYFMWLEAWVQKLLWMLQLPTTVNRGGVTTRSSQAM